MPNAMGRYIDNMKCVCGELVHATAVLRVKDKNITAAQTSVSGLSYKNRTVNVIFAIIYV